MTKNRVRGLVQVGRAKWFKRSGTADAFDSAVVGYLESYIDPPGDLGSILDVMNKIYSDPANVCIPWMAAFSAATQILEGASAAKREEYLSRVRGFGAKECTF